MSITQRQPVSHQSTAGHNTRARGVPDRTVISGESESLTGTHASGYLRLTWSGHEPSELCKQGIA